MARHRENVIFLCAGQLVLSSDDLDIVRRTGLKTILRHLEFPLRQRLPVSCHAHLLGCRIQIQQGCANILIDTASEVSNLIVDTLDATSELLRFTFAVTVEDCGNRLTPGFVEDPW